MKNLAIIPARSGSKGVQDKNIRLLNGKPLLAYSIMAAVESGQFDVVMVSTDSAKYADIAVSYGAEVPFLRSAKNAGDTASSWDMVEEVLLGYRNMRIRFETFCLLQPTSPLRSAGDIQGAYQLYKDKNASAVVSVCPLDYPLTWCGSLEEGLSLDGFINRAVAGQRQKQKQYYRLNGAIYIVNTDAFEKDRFLYREGSYAYIMPPERSLDIDSENDMKLAKIAIGGGYSDLFIIITSTPSKRRCA